MPRRHYTAGNYPLGSFYGYAAGFLFVLFLALLSMPFQPLNPTLLWLAGTAVHAGMIVVCFAGSIRLLDAWATKKVAYIAPETEAERQQPSKPSVNSSIGTMSGYATVVSWSVAAICIYTTGLNGSAPGFLAPYSETIFGSFFAFFLFGLASFKIWQNERASYMPPPDRHDEHQTPHGNAQFATAEELRRAGFIEK